MLIKHKGQRVAIFLDVQNLYHSAKNLYNARVDFSKVVETAVSRRTLIRAFAYVIKTKTGEEKFFFEALINLGIEIRVKELQEFYGGFKKGDWDVGLAVDAIRMAPGMDAIVLVTGDGDFVPLVEYLKNKGKRVEVIAFERSASLKLKEAADEFINLGDNSKKFLLTSSASPKQRQARRSKKQNE
jgi:uncharacterized protein (TIGR00288 family)